MTDHVRNTPSSWRDLAGSRSLEDYLAVQFGDKRKFRITKRAYPEGTRNTGGSVAVKCFVLEGRCRYSFGEVWFDLAAGQFCELPEGRYSFEVLGDSGCTFFTVLPLPDSVQKT